MITCKNCGKEFAEGKFCPECGAQVVVEQSPVTAEAVTYVENVVPVVKPKKGKGVVSMILGIMAFFSSCGGVGIILAIVSFFLGISAKKAAKKVGAKNGFATTGIIFSILSLLPFILIVVLIVLSMLGSIVPSFGGNSYDMGAIADMAGAMYY